MNPKLFVITGSLLANAALLAAFALRPALAPPAVRDFFARQFQSAPTAPATPAARSAPPKPPAAAGPLWTQLGSDDFATLIARLRAAGFPEPAIRATIQALLNERHEARMDALHRTPPGPRFWKSTDTLAGRQRRSDERQLAAERARLEREILGTLKTTDDHYATRQDQYGKLSPAKIDQLDRLNADYNDLELEVRTATEGIFLPADREKLALLEREKRADLAALLSPAELAEYDLRSSPVTSRLRSAFGAFRATEEEFRTILQIHRSLEEALYPYSRFPPSSTEDRDARSNAQAGAETELDVQLRTALGDQRYAEFTRAQSRDYQNLVTLAARAGLPTQAAIDAYNLRDRLAQESNRIFYDDALDVPQKRAALETLAQTTRAQLTSTLGPGASETYLKTASWLGQVERGGAVTFRANGMSFRGLPANSVGGRSGGTGSITTPGR